MRAILWTLLCLGLLARAAGDDYDSYEDGDEYGDEYDDDYDDYEEEEYDCGEDDYCTYSEEEYPGEEYEWEEESGEVGEEEEELLVTPPSFGHMENTEVTVDLGNTARLVCIVQNLGRNPISWVKGEEIISMGGTMLDKERSSRRVEEDASTSTLTITLVTREDMGVYSCQVNQPGNPLVQEFIVETRAPALVSILEAPASGEISLKEGEALQLNCQGTGDPLPTTSWHRAHSSLPLPSTGGTLQVPSVSPGDSGTYVCEASNGFGQPARATVALTVLHAPVVEVSESYRREPATRAIQAIVLTCVVKAHPEASVRWTRGDATLDSSRVVERREEGRLVLEIPRPSQEDLGSYSCEAANAEGTNVALLVTKETDLMPSLKDAMVMVEEQIQEVVEEVESLLPSSAPSSLPCLLLLLPSLAALY